VLFFFASATPGIPLFWGSVRMFDYPTIAQSVTWTAFLINLLCFVTFFIWCAWPLLSAGVDDHSEVSRYRAFPVTPLRLLVSSTVASLIEPRALVFASPLLGAGFALLRHQPPTDWFLGLLAFAVFALMTAAWSRVATHLMLNVLRAPNSAEILGGGFFIFLTLCAFIPPVDVSWLTAASSGGLGTLNMKVVANAAHALGRVPPGYLGRSLLSLRFGVPPHLFGPLLGMGIFTVVGVATAYVLLLSFYRGVGRAGKSTTERKVSNPMGREGNRFRTLLARELLDLWNNPRARLLVAVPFVLAIFLKVLSGRSLFAFFLGLRADAWLMGGLSLYAAVVLGSTFSQNAFAYDGNGMAVFLCAPIPLRDVLRAKNVAHAISALALGLLTMVFYRLYFHAGARWDFALAAAGLLCLVPVLLAAGNFLSFLFPTKFHANLQRRDRLPLLASMLGVAAASLGCGPFAWTLRHSTGEPGGWEAIRVLGFAAVSFLAYSLLFPLAVRGLELRREVVFRGVTRD
jgi:ABC-2 type transport system permease protein